MTEKEIGLDEWLAELNRLQVAESPGGVTVRELCDASGLGPNAVRKRLHRAVAGGRVRVVRVRRPDLCGRIQAVPAYQFLAKEATT